MDLSTEIFGFVDEFFLDLSTIFLDFLTIFFGFVEKKIVDLLTKISNLPMTLSNDHIIVWVTRPEFPKGTKDEVKLARRDTN